MSITTTLATLQAKHLAIVGITTAPTNWPSSINTADLPMAITLPAEGTWTTAAIGLDRQDRTYRIMVYVEPLGQRTVDERMDAVIPLIGSLGAAYLGDLGIAADTNIDQVQLPITDSGPTVLTFAEIDYIGFEMRLTITEKG